MNKMIITAFTVPGVPVSKARPRMTRAGHAFTPEKTRNYEALVTMLAAEAMNGASPVDDPIAMDIVAVFPQPKSWPKWKRKLAEQGLIAYTTRPDEDNIGKSISDAINGIVYVDDAQIVRKTVTKLFETDGHDVGCSVLIYRDNGYPCQIKRKPE